MERGRAAATGHACLYSSSPLSPSRLCSVLVMDEVKGALTQLLSNAPVVLYPLALPP